MQHQSETIPIDPALLCPPSPQPSCHSSAAISVQSSFYLADTASSSVPQSISEWGSASGDAEHQELKNEIQNLKAIIEQQDQKIDHLEAKYNYFGAILKWLANDQGIDLEGEIEKPPAKKLKMKDLNDRVLTKRKRNDLTLAQKDVRSELLKRVNESLRKLSGTLMNSHIPAKKDEPGEHRAADGTVIALVPDFTRDVTWDINERLITQAATLVYRENIDLMKWDMRFSGVTFTQGDVREIAKGAFRSWKDAFKIATSDEAKDKALAEKKKASRVQRKRQKKSDREQMEDTYHERYGCSIAEILETDYMSDYVSELETSDIEARNFHRGQMVSASHLLGKGEGEVIFERIRPAFRSDEYNLAIARADEIIEEQEATTRKRKVGARCVDLGRTHDRIPKIAPFPFMVSQAWKAKCVDGKRLERPFRMRAEDPAGYGKKKGMIGQRHEIEKL